MQTLLQSSVDHGYWILFVAVLLDGLGVPITAMPLLFVAGGLAAAGRMSFLSIIFVTTVASALGDILWYLLGWSGGPLLFTAISRLTHHNNTQLLRCLHFVKCYSLAFLVISKFIPGVSSFAPPAAGMAKMPLSQFVLLDTVGRVIWATSVSWLGYAFHWLTNIL
jgi:membrane protein DedA with SNARE-associated domain